MKTFTCPGFQAAAMASGLKKNKKKDLGIIYSAKPATVAGVFTKNRIQAASVLLDKERIKAGTCHAIIANSGNANACTGDQGMQDAVSITKTIASALGIAEEMVLCASTGVIGVPLPIEKIKTATPELVNSMSSEGFSDFAEAIMTTDTVPKIVSKQGTIDGIPFTVTGVAKGAGMIRPDMATMLCFVCSDIQIEQEDLQKSLSASTDKSFNRITVDGDSSTNDMVLVMANGLSGAVVSTETHLHAFQTVLDDILIQLAKMLVKDGEGATKLVEITVKGAASVQDAEKVVDTVAHSNLVKTALFGEDANWGRIIAAAGRAHVPIEPDKIDIYFNNVLMVKNGLGCGDAAEAEATAVLKKTEFTILIDLNMGDSEASMWTCDFSVDYVRINADYRS